MYHCNIQMYFWNVTGQMRQLIEKMEPLPNFVHETIDAGLSQKIQLERADFVLADLHEYVGEEQRIMKELSEGRKKGSMLVVCAEKSQADVILKLAEGMLSDIWILPLSDEEIRFRFLKLQQWQKTEKDLWLANSYLDTTIDSMTDLVWYKDKKGAHMKVNESFCEAVGKTKQQVEGRGHYYIWDITPDEYAKGEYVCMESEYEVMEKRVTCIFDEKVRTKSGMKEFLTYKSPLFDLDGSIMGTVGVANDVTQERAYERIMKKQVNTDFLTGLYNRRYIYKYIEQNSTGPYALFYLDLDNFKHVNDKFGHLQGDHALITVADVLRERMPESVAARIGGDEFLVIEKKFYTGEEIKKKCLWLQEEIDKAFHEDEMFRALSVSVGQAYVEEGEVSLDELIGKADALMYSQKNRKKQSGRTI